MSEEPREIASPTRMFKKKKKKNFTKSNPHEKSQIPI